MIKKAIKALLKKAHIEIRFPTDKEISCDGKVKYRDIKSARGAVVAMKKKGVCGLEAYRCRHCDGWHVGHGF